jgi:hypothetical protein
MTRENEAKLLVDRILAHPGLKERVDAILDIAENTSGELITADQAEGKAIEEVQKLGKELLKEWAFQRHKQAVEIAKSTHPTAKKHEKKSSIGNQHLEK